MIHEKNPTCTQLDDHLTATCFFSKHEFGCGCTVACGWGRGGLCVHVSLYMELIYGLGYSFKVCKVCVLLLFISTYKGLIAIRHVGGIFGSEQETQ